MTPESIPSGALKVADELKALRRRRSGIVCGLLTAAACDMLDAEQDALIDRLAALVSPSPATGAMADALAAGDGTLHGAIDYWQQRALAAETTGAQEWEARMSLDGKRVVLDSADFEHDAALILNGDFESPEQRMNYARGLADKLNAPSSAKREAEPHKLVSDRDYLRIFDEGRCGSDKLSGTLRGIRAVIAAYEFAASQVEPEEKP